MDPPDYNRKFAEEHDFGYPLISNGEAVIRQFGACRREDRCTGKRTTAVIRADGTLLDFIDPFSADTGPDELRAARCCGRRAAARARARRTWTASARAGAARRLRGHDTAPPLGEHARRRGRRDRTLAGLLVRPARRRSPADRAC